MIQVIVYQGTSERGEECGKGPVFQGIVSKVPLIPGKSSPRYEFLGSVCWRDMETGTCNPGTFVGESQVLAQFNEYIV